MLARYDRIVDHQAIGHLAMQGVLGFAARRQVAAHHYQGMKTSMTEQTAVGLDFKKFLIEEINRQWVTRGEPVLLAKLGQIAASRGYVLHKELNGLKLSQFIQQELSEDLEVLSPNDSGTILAVGPKNPPAPQVITLPQAMAPTHEGLTRALVAAFSHSIRDDFERYMRVDPPLRFLDLPRTEVRPEGFVHIERVHLITSESPQGAYAEASIHAQIVEWLEKNGLDIQRFMHKTPAQVRGEKSVLTLLMESLTESELKRVSLPLDIVGKLMGK
ncbi:hypothetical protein [Pseudomonas sp. NPDC088444]|uniref:hypothetical protein n=1 Tax=Pseudomonas sp. NPDC088444 TaxID=3364456 RepID=UPI00384F6B84